jgi:hypothetical protein
MTLTNFWVHPNLEIDVDTNSRAVIITADAGATQVVAFITLETIDDSFPQHHLTNNERIGLVNSNLVVICDIISAKYARGDVHPHHSARSTIPRIDISSGDLQMGPRLSDDYLVVARGAG